MKKKVAIIVNSSWNLINFRKGLIETLLRCGFEVTAIAPRDDYVKDVCALGCLYVPIEMDSQGKNFIRDLGLFFSYRRELIKLRPDVVLCFTIKPNIYASIASNFIGVPVLNNVAGLGIVFATDGWLNRFVRKLYNVALARSAKVFFQNRDDLDFFVSNGLVPTSRVERLPGSGVDLDTFKPVPLPAGAVIRFVLIARMLWDKGVGEYVEAARILKKRGVSAEFSLLGFLDVKNPSAITRTQMDEWVSEGVVKYLGVSDNVRVEIAKADCVVLPSFYREGTPRTLLEAAAMARPIVTTNSVGCRDVVDDGVNGYLCNPQDASDLADKMERMARLEPSERELMGLNGRTKVELEFDEQIVIMQYLRAIHEAIDRNS